MASAYNQLETKLRVAKDRLVHKLTVVNDQIKNEDKNLLTLDTNLRQLKQCHERVTTLRTQLEEIVKSTKEADVITKFNTDIEAYEELYCDCEDAIAQLTATIEHQKAEKTTVKETSVNTSSNNLNQLSVKLPKLPKLTFSGDITSYLEFKQSFNATVGVTDLTDSQKLAYLKQMMVGLAENDLKGMPVMDKNYAKAWEVLEEKYGNIQRMIKLLYNKITQLPQTSSATSQLRKTYDALEVTLRTLESLGEEFENNTILLNTIMEKFPKSIVYEIHKDTSSSLDLRQFRTSMKSLIKRREELNFTDAEEQPSTTYTTETLLAKTNNMKKPTQKCIFCSSENHWSDECDQHKTLASRKENIKGRCFICLRKGHSVKECTADRVCVHCGQRKNHHRSLCPKLFDESSQQHPTQQQSADTETKSDDKSNSTVTCLLSDREQNWLFTAVSSVSNPSGDKKFGARMILDGGSKRTFITSKLAQELKLPIIATEKLVIDTVGNNIGQEVVSNTVELLIKTHAGEQVKIEASTIPKIIDGIETFNPNELTDKLILKNKVLADKSNRSDVQILIGIDHLYDFLTSEVIKIAEHQYLIGSKLGWLFAGKLKSQRSKSSKTSCLLIKTLQTNTNEDLKTLWELDTLGIKADPDMNDEIALKSFEETIKFENNRYEVSWPLLEEEPNLKPNYGLAINRLDNLVKKSKIEFLSKYDKIIQQYLESEFVEPVENQEDSSTLISYLPHHGVQTESKTTPLRIVFDGSAKQKGDKSVNDVIYKGKNLIEQIVLIMIRWRTYGIAIISDIEKAFLQLLINEKFRDLLRFLWVKDYQLKTTKDNIRVLRWRRIPFGINASPFTLAATILFHLRKYAPQIASKLSKALYVDNMITGGMSIEEVSKLIEETVKIFSDASMKLRQWHTNEKSLIDLHPTLDWLAEDIVSVLGINWNTVTDTLSVKPVLINTDVATKRSILKQSSKLYDPLGLWSPVILKAKLLLQLLWEENYHWDQPIPTNLESQWFELREEFRIISQVQIPRCCLSRQKINNEVQLHVFTDASKKAYGVVIYVRVETESGADTQLIFAKSRVSPVKTTLKIPRLELLAILIGNRALRFIQEAFSEYHLTKLVLWSDSKCAISWVRSDKNLSPWVEKRVTEIRKNNQLEIKYVRSQDNPADIASRGATVNELSEFWWKGPQWLRENESNWPDVPVNESESTEFQTEVRNTTLLITEPKNNLSTNSLNISLEDFTLLTEDKILDAIKHIQTIHFSNRDSNFTKQLNLIEDNGILRVKGRLSNLIQVPNDEFPILLPNNDQFVNLLILHTHRKLYHAGVSQTLAEIRKKYWLLGGRRVVYNVIRNCKNCKVFSGPAYKYPIMPPIPGYRLKREFAFTYVGVDVLGPLYVCKKKGTDKKKNWICLFTCLITRAVHLEQLEDMTSEELLLAFRRMFARRGITKFLLSDNAPQFNVLKNLLSGVPDNNLKNIEWKQIPAFSPWSGGVYERMVALVKNALRKTFYQVTLTRRQLQTSAVEIEAVINSRPIVYVGADDGTTLSPNDLLNIPFNIPLNFEPTTNSDILRDIANNWKRGQQQLDSFWSVWRDGYVEMLRTSTKKLQSGFRSAPHPPEINDVVIVSQERLPRGQWAAGVIVALNNSEDGQVRSAQVKLSTGSTITRPICMLHPIESEIDRALSVEEPTSTTPEISTTSTSPTPMRTSSRREAAIQARDRIREWIKA
ncbi:uncharacterized protein LOC135840645 [Planococcus citri]|uniref:uncharacterized protein LOC135840645 n=1 Tax=Planococcus citri TaxID=170843 RepID=UPI0031F8F4AF